MNGPIEVGNTHNHKPDPTRVNCLKVIDEIKVRAKVSKENPMTIIREAGINLDDKERKNNLY